MDITLQTHLGRLEASGLIRLAQTQPELEYLFRHTLIQETAYGSLVKSSRRELHRVVGETLERAAGEVDGALAPVLAHHFAEAGDDERALKYYTLAGEAAFAVYANAEAIQHYTRALEIARRDPQFPLSNLCLRRGRALELNSQFPAALDNYEQMEAEARARGDRGMQLAALMARALLHSTATHLFNEDLGGALASEALQLARELGDKAAEARIWWGLINLNRFASRLKEARECGERSLTLARELGLREQTAYILNDLAHVIAMSENVIQSLPLLEEAAGLWRQLGNLPMLADSLATACLYSTFSGNFPAAIARSAEAFQISQSIGNLWGQSYSLSMVGGVYWEQGEITRAIEVMQQSIALGERAGYHVSQVTSRSELGLLYAAMGQFAHGVELARLAVQHAEVGLPPFRAYALAILAQLLLTAGESEAGGRVLESLGESDTSNPLLTIPASFAVAQFALAQRDYDRGLRLMNEALARMRQGSFLRFVPQALLRLGQAHAGAGDSEAAHRHFTEARAEAEALGSRWMLWQILAELAQAEERRGDITQVEALRREARADVEYIATHSPPELRASFLELPMVRQITE